MKTPNYDNTVGKHPIPHAKGIAKDETSDIEKQKKEAANKKARKEEEEE
ncbi:hypothetical protein LX77_02770 [Gelidibacter algens]|uniref:Uncharacterized protein n=1 Tax=Gelidibacter algens TaxID=49280 RepID=A0A327RZW0_9FLAO|nr:hypothetical protein [Gelidibacter algens]RAJ22111.1 hypothetical protein LX77_02770 [Gelidibacter algens]